MGGCGRPDHDSLELIAMLVDCIDEQQLKGEELPIERLHLFDFPDFEHPVLSLMKASREWKIDTLSASHLGAVLLRALAQSAATGHIGTIKFFVDQSQVTDNWSEEKKTEQKEDVKAVWEITEKVEVQDSHPAGTVVQIEGGRGKESKITFEEAFQTVLYKIC